MAARWCKDCRRKWPTNFGKCPVCLITTDWWSAGEAMSPAEAHRLTCHAEFDRYYARYEEQREIRGDPTPEDLGALDAKEIIKLERELKNVGEAT